MRSSLRKDCDLMARKAGIYLRNKRNSSLMKPSRSLKSNIALLFFMRFDFFLNVHMVAGNYRNHVLSESEYSYARQR